MYFGCHRYISCASSKRLENITHSPYLPSCINCFLHSLIRRPFWVHSDRFFFLLNIGVLSSLAFLLFTLSNRWRDAHLLDEKPLSCIGEWSYLVLFHSFQYGFASTFVHAIRAVSWFQVWWDRPWSKPLKLLLFGFRNHLFVNDFTKPS